jgi:hypothetical protein
MSTSRLEQLCRLANGALRRGARGKTAVIQIKANPEPARVDCRRLAKRHELLAGRGLES